MPRAVRISHPGRVIDASTGLTKADLVRYYVEVAPWLLPHLRDRHTFIRRAPEGLGGPVFFQEHPENVAALKPTDPALWPGHDPAIRFDSAEDLAAAAQMGMVELHTWNSTAAAIGKADRLVFDLDPGDGVPWAQLKQAAVLVRALLAELGLESWLKTSGGRGLHLAVSIRPEIDHDGAKALARSIADHLATTLPQLFSVRSGAQNRVRRVFVDYLRNGRSQVTASAFSARARPGVGVSMPLAWDELDALTAGDQWSIANAMDRLAALPSDPWADYWTTRQTTRKALRQFPQSSSAASIPGNSTSVKPNRVKSRTRIG